MIEETLTAPEESLEELKKAFPGVATARVINLEDPLMLGRVQVQLASVDAVDLQPWARIALPMAGLSHGSYFIPNVGDDVLVAFEHGSLSAPYIIGSLWTALARPPISTPLEQKRVIRTLSGNQVVISETPAAVTVQSAPTAPEALPAPVTPVGPHSSLQVASDGIRAHSPASVEIKIGATTQILATPTSITIEKGASKIELFDAAVSIKSPAISIEADGLVTIKGSQVHIN